MPNTDKLTVSEIFRKVADGLQRFPEKAKEVNATYLFRIAGDQGGNFLVNLRDNLGVYPAEGPADCVLEVKDRDFLKIYKGTLSAFKAALTGQLKITGPIELAVRVKDVLDA